MMKPIIYSMFAGLFISLSIALFSIFVGILFASKPAISQTLPNPSSPISYCVDPDWIPYEAIRNGEHIGISSEFIKLLAEKTDFTFDLVPTSSWEQTLRYLQEGRCQLTPMLNKTERRSQYLSFSDIYFRAPNVLVSTREQPFLQGFENIGEQTVAIPKGYRLFDYVLQHYPATNIISVSSEKAGLEAVANGSADLFIGSLYSINAYIQQRDLNNLKISGWLHPEDELRIGVTAELETLLPVLNGALASMDETEFLAAYNRWNNASVIDETNYQLMWLLGLVSVIILAIFGFLIYLSVRYSRRLEYSVAKLEFLSQHDALTKLHNREFFNQIIELEQRTQADHSALCMVIIDIDHFKRINDNFGHKVGDQVLVELSVLLTWLIRDTDLLARWGGEEFVILCRHSTADETKQLCERIAAALATTQIGPGLILSCSFGIAQLSKNEQLMDCFERADKALYQAKANGRNQVCLAPMI